MAEYSIKDLEVLSGIKAHTIRIWEKRYKLIKPKRTSTNIRLYSDSDLKKIINVAVASNAGLRISHIAQLNEKELIELVNQKSLAGNDFATPIDKLVIATVEMSERAFIKTLADLEKKLGFEKLVTEVLYSFLDRIGILWQLGKITPAQEHFVSNLIRQKIISAIDRLPLPPLKAPKAILFLPENEFHEIGLLFYNFLARKHSRQTIYLGQSVPFNDLQFVVTTHKPKIIITSLITAVAQENLTHYIKSLSQTFKAQTILISGMAVKDFNFKPFRNVRHFSSVVHLKEYL